MEIQITLSGDAYNSRTKGVIKKLLNGMEFTQLGNGSFTGFIVKSTSLKEVEKRLEKLKVNGISVEEVDF